MPEEALRPSDDPLEIKKERLYAAIEATQAFLHKRESPEGVMESVRDRYPAPLYFVESNRQSLERLGLPRLDAFYYAMIPALTRTALSQRRGPKPRLDTLSRMSEYLKALYVGIHVECFYLILLDRGGCLLRPVLLQRGGVDNAPFYLGKVLEVALSEGARHVVLAHNHPGGTRRPSREDLVCTLQALNAFASLRVQMLDHLIVVRDEVVSIRACDLLPSMLWNAVPGGRVGRDWIDVELFPEEE